MINIKLTDISDADYEAIAEILSGTTAVKNGLVKVKREPNDMLVLVFDPEEDESGHDESWDAREIDVDEQEELNDDNE